MNTVCDHEDSDYLVFVDDRSRFTRQNRRVYRGAYPSEALAIEACQQIVDRSLRHLAARNGTESSTAERLTTLYLADGPDPFIICPDGFPRSAFRSSQYAAQQSRQMFSADQSTGRTRIGVILSEIRKRIARRRRCDWILHNRTGAPITTHARVTALR